MHQLLFGFQSYSNRKWEVSKESGVHLTWTPFGNYDGQWACILMVIEKNTHTTAMAIVEWLLACVRWDESLNLWACFKFMHINAFVE